MDTINIKGLEIFANHGVLKEENTLGQKFIINATLFVDIKEAGQNDDLDKTVNYAEVCNEIREFVQANTFKLIETVAEKLANKLLIKFNNIKTIKLEIKKPWAPIMQNVDYVGVEIVRGWRTVYISMGSNIGDKMRYLEKGIAALNNNACCKVTKISPFYTTEPVGDVEQDDFLNCCIKAETLYSPYELLSCINKIEAENGRERIIHWGPRTLDMDIILYEGCVINEQQLTIPHKEMVKREFVLRPLNDIAPYEIHPVLGESIQTLFENLTGEN